MPYEFGEEISDRGCQLTGEKCGRNMVFVIVNFIALNNSADCIQQCSCEDGYNYLEEFGECRKKVKISFKIIIKIIIKISF